jgi:hypothetical protein
MNLVKIFPALFLFSFSISLHAEEAVNTPPDAVKGALPFCTNDLSLYESLKNIGETASGGGVETSQLAMQQGGLGVGFLLDMKNGNWSFLTTDKTQKTCFVVTGKKWQRIKTEIPSKIILGGEEKRVGYCASFARMSQELLEEGGKMESGFGEQDADLSGTDMTKVTIHFFTSGFGSFSSVAKIVYKNSPELACVEATGIGWKFEDDYEKYIGK